jgi:hypothetical protein
VGGEGIAPSRIAPSSIFFDKRARHAVTLDGADEMSQLSRRYHGNCRSKTATQQMWRMDERGIL